MALADTLRSLTALLDGGSGDPRPPTRYPAVAVDLSSSGVTAVRIAEDRKTGRRRLAAVARRELPEGAIEVSLTRPNVLVPEPVTAALREVLAEVGPVEHRISMLIPDHAARVALLGFATLPRTRRELVELTRFRMAKSLPFKPDEAAIDLMVMSTATVVGTTPAAVSVLAAFIHRAVLAQYEALLASLGHWPGLVGLATLELYNLFRPMLETPSDGKDVLLLNVTGHDLTLLILREGSLIFYRCKAHPGSGAPEETVAAVQREIYTSFAFYQEKLLGRGIGHAWLRCVGVPDEGIREAVTREAGCEVAALDPLAILPAAPELAAAARPLAILAAPAAGAAAGRRP
jgi:hypothetical protein